MRSLPPAFASVLPTDGPLSFVIDGVHYPIMADAERERQRAEILRRHAEVEDFLSQIDEEDADQLQEIIARCMVPSIEGFQFWCEHFGFTFDPRDTFHPHKRFILFEYQIRDAERIINAIINGENVFMEKSRDMGATWLVMAIGTWAWLFWESFQAIIGSRKEDLVDMGSVDDLFGKIDYILDRQPHWLLNGYDGDNRAHRKTMYMRHPLTGNTVTGESANKNFSRGARANLVYLDEFAFWEDDSAVWTGVQDTAPCKIVTSTPAGEHNQYARLRKTTKIRITQHWTLHPHKNRAWYEREVEKRQGNLVAIAQELNIDYAASAGRLALPMMEQMKPFIIVPHIEPTDKSNTGHAFYAHLDWGTSNPSAFHVHRVLQISENPRLYKVTTLFEYYEPSDLPRLAAAIKNCPYYAHIRQIFADPSMWYYNQNTKDGVTSLAILFQQLYGIHLTPGAKGDTYALEQTKMMWSDPDNIRWQITEDCPNLWRELQGLRYETQTAFAAQKKNLSERLVDKDNHSWDGWKYFVNSFIQAPQAEAPPEPAPIMGWTAMQQEFAGLKSMKMKKLTQKSHRKRRLFVHS